MIKLENPRYRKRRRSKKNKYEKPSSTIDYRLFFITLLLVIIGNLAVFTASYVFAEFRYEDSMYFLKRTALFSSLGFFFMFVISHIPYKLIKKLENHMYAITIILLILTKFSPLGIERNFAKRWILIGPLGTLMPSEIAKFVIIFMTASIIDNYIKKKDFKTCLIKIAYMVIPLCILVIIQPDLSTTVTMLFTPFVMFLAAGAPYFYLFILSILGVSSISLLIAIEPYRMKRFTTFLNPFEDKLGSGFQVVQSLYAISSGGILGLGMGQSRQKHFYLPEPQNDFIFAIICEEFGIFGAGLILMLFIVLILICVDISLKVDDIYASMLSIGIACQIGVQVLINVGVATSSIPNTGIALPFISYGGNSLVIMMSAIGVILNISRYRKNI